jgi:hypothetical protein
MKFSQEQTHKVRLHHRDLGDLGEAQLRFGGEWGVLATMGLLATVPRLGPNSPLDFVSATTEDGHAFTLCECRIHGFSLIATFLVHGSITENHDMDSPSTALLSGVPRRLARLCAIRSAIFTCPRS